MSTKFDKTTWFRWLEAFNNKDLDLLDRLTDDVFAENLVQHIPDMPDLAQGIAGQKAFQHEMIAKNPDFHFTIDDYLSDGDKIIGRGTMQMKNPTTGTMESFVVIEIDRLEDGKIAEVWNLTTPGTW